MVEAFERLGQDGLCAIMSVGIACRGGTTQQRVYFHGLGTRDGPSRGSMAHNAMGVKRCYGVQNALRWLFIKGTPSAYT